MKHFTLLMQFLRDRQKFLLDLDKEIKLDKKIFSLLISSCVFFAIYGAIIGSFGGPLQVVSSAIKLPALYLITLVICLPNLYFLDVVSGSKRSFGQYLALLLAAEAVIGVILFGFAPITLFFRISIDDYQFFQLYNIAIFTITGILGVKFFYRGILFLDGHDYEPKSDDQDSKLAKLAKRSPLILKGWLVLFGLVGSQLAWTLRPFFGSPGQPFSVFRQLESNFYLQVLRLIGGALGFN
ncbi:actin-binding WH2 domain-containing protein [Lyngbya aestuarii]|uniref:actin-binding WH2 domain-containing protein n=1 Tax=Lyngbya aestuarii TaxID=118322 RepID=UPI00403DDAFF